MILKSLSKIGTLIAIAVTFVAVNAVAQQYNGGGNYNNNAGIVPVASATVAGKMKCDGTTTTCAADGTVTATAGGTAGINQLTGDVTAGPASGSTAATVAAVGGKALVLGGAFTTTGTGAITFALGNSTATLTFQGTDTYVGRATTDTLTNKTLTSPTINAGALSGTFSGTPTYSGIPIYSGLSSGTQVSCLGLDSGNHIVLNAAACGSGGSSSGVGVQGGQSPSTTNMGNTGTIGTPVALTAAKYVYTTTGTYTAARYKSLPDSATQGVGDIEILDAVGTLTSTNTLNICPAGSDTINGVNGCLPGIGTAYASLRLHNDGAGAYTTAGGATTPAFTASTHNFVTGISGGGVWSQAQPAFTDISAGTITAAQMLVLPSADLYVGNGSNVPAAVALSGDCTMANTGAITCTKSSGTAFGTAAFDNTGTSGATIPLLNGNNTHSGAETFGETHGTTYAPSYTSNNYTAAASDCGKILLLPTGTTPTVTLPNLNSDCRITVMQNSATQVTMQAASGGTLVSVNSYTKTKAQNATLFLFISVPSVSAATWVLAGDGA